MSISSIISTKSDRSFDVFRGEKNSRPVLSPLDTSLDNRISRPSEDSGIGMMSAPGSARPSASTGQSDCDYNLDVHMSAASQRPGFYQRPDNGSLNSLEDRGALTGHVRTYQQWDSDDGPEWCRGEGEEGMYGRLGVTNGSDPEFNDVEEDAEEYPGEEFIASFIARTGTNDTQFQSQKSTKERSFSPKKISQDVLRSINFSRRPHRKKVQFIPHTGDFDDSSRPPSGFPENATVFSKSTQPNTLDDMRNVSVTTQPTTQLSPSLTLDYHEYAGSYLQDDNSTLLSPNVTSSYQTRNDNISKPTNWDKFRSSMSDLGQAREPDERASIVHSASNSSSAVLDYENSENGSNRGHIPPITTRDTFPLRGSASKLSTSKSRFGRLKLRVKKKCRKVISDLTVDPYSKDFKSPSEFSKPDSDSFFVWR
ncbi:uncharacterized protein IL334_001632 [Kwoniella shivajii]|uniref:Uncharacterized protein n=1 Tax=Kwoniella shivajii TaxID=564305 RepID=A0ABZ1CSP5_9TREE|nr:hypothetical protein IL334_001632 [Kwoniella shivajii]